MAVAAQALNIAQYANMSNNPLIMAVTDSLIDYGNVAQDLPLFNNASLIVNGARWEGNLPTVTWRQLNAEGVSTIGTPSPWQEQAFILTNYIDVDKFLVQDKNQIGNIRANQVEAYLKAQTYDFNFKYFKNDHITGDQNAFVGLRARIDDAASANKWGVRPENKIDANIDISQATLATTPANGNKFLELINQLLWSVDSPQGQNVVLYMNDVMQRRFDFLLRALGTSGGLTITQDQYDRSIMRYKNAIIRDPGLKSDQTTRIIAGNGLSGSSAVGETSAGADSTGASAVYTSIYAVNYGEDHFFGWQFAPLNVEDLGRLNNGTIYRTFIDWAIGLGNASTRSLGRLYDIKIA